jgi:hypothetical protein
MIMTGTTVQMARKAAIIIMLLGATTASAESGLFGNAEDVEYARKLWSALEEANLAGENAVEDKPYIGEHPHGAVLETIHGSVTVEGYEGEVVTKRSYSGEGVSVEVVIADRKKYINDVTVMFKRESGYDKENKDWFWAKYNPDGSLDSTPNGVKLAGRVAKGKKKGCIACHRKAPGDDFLYIN